VSYDAAALTGMAWLFVPGDRPDRFGKAVMSGADEVICDLEDSVAERAKSAARQHVVELLSRDGQAWVRVNACTTPSYALDVEALVGLPGLRGVMVPKAEHPAALTALRRRLGPGIGIVALLETAVGVLHAAAIGRCGGVDRLAFGSIDFAADIDAAHDDDALLTARMALVLASRAAAKPAPIDGITAGLDQAEVVEREAAKARRLGFGGKLCIHPAQIPAVRRAFQASPEEVAAAQAILDISAAPDGDGARRHEGQMIDKATIGRARRILASAAAVQGLALRRRDSRWERSNSGQGDQI
jgi:citrate lyase subunit beta / citryl-CoA lyase